MPRQTELRSLVVRPITSEEESYWNESMSKHHYLGFRQLVGESIKYVAHIGENPVALLGWGTAAFKCTCRDEWIGWSKEQQWRRLVFVANNLRFLILPNIRIPNLASKILAVNCRRLSMDWIHKYGHPIVLAETFVDHSRFAGTCYRAAGWSKLGQTSGYGRNAGKYFYHGNSKTVFVSPLHPKARHWLGSPFLVQELCGGVPLVNLNRLDLDGNSGLLERLRLITDPRKARGIRHKLVSTLAIAMCATLAGYRSYNAIAEWAADLSQDQLARFGCRYDSNKRKYIEPSEPTIRRHLQSVDADQLDTVVNEWLAQQVDPDAISVDGKSLRGSRTADTKPVHLLAAISHDEGTVLAQRSVGAKTNEITEFRDLLEPLELTGKVVTADAMHTQIEHAKYLVEDKRADYLFTVKDNQSNLKKDIEALDDEDFSP